jgi:hypothetical protein
MDSFKARAKGQSTTIARSALESNKTTQHLFFNLNIKSIGGPPTFYFKIQSTTDSN